MAVSKKVGIFIYMTTALAASFLFGKFFGESLSQQSHASETPRVFIEQLTTKLKIQKSDSRIEIYLNGEKLEDDISINP